jgi:teichoic acid transport system permease protein
MGRPRDAVAGRNPWERPLSDDRRLSAPGQLSYADDSLADSAHAGTTVLPSRPLDEYALEHGLRPSAARPPFRDYIRDLWRRWAFMLAFATARNIALYTEAKLGQLWQVLTPLLNAGVYFLVFGLLLHINRGIPNYLAFLVTGVFVFNFTQRAFITTSKVITDSLPLIRALQFPRAALPLAYVIIELQQMLLSMAVLVVILLATGEPLTWYWLLAIPALMLQTLFNVGAGLLVARIGAEVNDFSQLLPFLLRTWMYASGVIFSITGLAINTHRWAIELLQINPAAVYIALMRNSLMLSERLSQPGSQPYNAFKCHTYLAEKAHPELLDKLSPQIQKAHQYWGAYCHGYVSSHYYWLLAAGWAALALVVGFVLFWRAEERYGRG